MTREQIDEILQELRTCERAGLEEVDRTEVYCAVEFEAYRNGIPVTVRIEDHGPDSYPAPRYRCHVKTDEGAVAKSNGDETPELAILTTHWEDLDDPPWT